MPSAGGEASPQSGNQVLSPKPTVMELLARELGNAWAQAIHNDEQMVKESNQYRRASYSEECDCWIARARSFENALAEMMPKSPTDALVAAVILSMKLDTHHHEEEPLTQERQICEWLVDYLSSLSDITPTELGLEAAYRTWKRPTLIARRDHPA